VKIGGIMRQGDHRARLSARRREYGFNLLEVLIALLVLAIGLIGLAALQSVGLKSSHGAYLDSQAALLVYDMSDRIRANPTNANAYIGVPDCPDPVPTTPLATADLAEWACAVDELLPSGTGVIADLNNDRYRIRVEWGDRQLLDDEDPWAFQLEIQL
jgi:type IV pilus assembly protein PilV